LAIGRLQNEIENNNVPGTEADGKTFITEN
jgi:hypothetical protein